MKILKLWLLSCLTVCLCLSTAQAQSVNTLLRKGNDPLAGNPRGSITIVEFFDYQCSYCKVMVPILNRIIRDNPDVRVVYKELPLKGYSSEYASAAALAAHKQGKYLPFSHALLATRNTMSPATIEAIAKRTGINTEQLRKDMRDSSIVKQLRSNRALAEALQLNGTPAFFIGRTNASNIQDVKFVYGAMTQQELQQEINRLRR